LAGLVWVHATLGRHFSDRLNLQAQHQLITSGPYRWVRHPMYSFLFLFFIASAQVSANALIAACSLLLIANIWVRIKHEERMLRDHFGPAFDDYAAKTPRLLPGMR
jgi:protein-S-isoprenylcysteine O-methyltransferase Ste14